MVHYNAPMENHNDPRITIITRWLGTGAINLFGLPFAGKDTHGRELADFFNAPLLGGGDILRNSIIPPQMKQILADGLLFPTNDFINIVTPYLSKAEFQGRPLILSSVGRWFGEEHGVIGALETSHHPLKAVIYLNIDEVTMRERWAKSQEKQDRGNRPEDTEHVLDVRLKEFEEKTLPVIDFYRQEGLLIEIESILPQHEVTERILDELVKRAETSN
jgi:adenylate kinase